MRASDEHRSCGRALRALIAMLTLTLVAAACGDDDTTASDDGAGNDPAEPSEATESDSDDPGEAAAACRPEDDAEWDALVETAAGHGDVVLYTATPPPVIPRLVDKFEELYPELNVESTRASSGELITRIDQELQAGVDGGDVFITTEQLYLSGLSDAGNLTPLEGPNAESWPDDYVVTDGVAVVGAEPLTLLYNPTLVDTPPESYEDLLAPEYEGRVGASELAATTVVAWWDWVNETNGGDWMERFAEQNPRFYVGAVPNAQAVASGEVIASSFGNISASQTLIDEGAPLEFVIPDPAFGFAYAAAALGESGNPEGGQIFLDYLMSECGQMAWHGTGETASPINVEGALPIESIDPYDPTEYPEDVVAEFTAEWNNIFGR